jgi:hypothetical protein
VSGFVSPIEIQPRAARPWAKETERVSQFFSGHEGQVLDEKNITKALGHRDPDAPLRVMPSMLEWAKARGVNVI